ALAALTVRFLPKDWPGLKSIWLRPMILCGQHSLEIFCIGVFLSFAGQFFLAEIAGGAVVHALVCIAGIVIMSTAAWVFSWYKRVTAKGGPGNRKPAADLAGGGA
uniref:OpgC domain-containing protein n=1 Tax=Sphingobium fuliginis (strain ATCC 27551) TaxID=336203 RepID=UPI0037C52786